MLKKLLSFGLIVCCLLVSAGVLAQDSAVQEFNGVLPSEGGNIVYYDLYDMQAGQTFYAYLQSDSFDPFLAVCDITCEEIYADDDDSGGGLNAALEYTFPTNGDYSIAVTDYYSDSSSGPFRLLIGLNAPDVLGGNASPHGATFAVPYEEGSVSPTTSSSSAVMAETGAMVQEFRGSVSEDAEFSYFDLYGIQAGRTLYVYAESTQFDTLIGVCDILCEEIYAEDDDGGQGTNSALQFTIPADGDYSIAVTDCCSPTASGEFRILIGLDEPAVLTGNAQPTGHSFAEVYAAPTPVPANPGEPQVQEFFGAVSATREFVYYDLFNAQAGRTIYVYGESNDFDPLVVVCDIDCEEVFASDDDSGGNRNAALEYVIPANGDYSIAITDCCSSSASGNFRILIGLDEPAVLSGNATPTGPEFIVPYQATQTPSDFGSVTYDGERMVQELTGSITPDVPNAYFDIFGIEAGQTIQLYVESGDFDTIVGVCDILCEEMFDFDDDSGDGTNSALEFTIPETNDYSILVSDCCDDNASGEFRILIGINAPDVLTGTAEPTGAEIAEVYVAGMGPLADADRISATDCSVLEERPTLSGPVETYETENFIIHFTREGVDKASLDFVEDVARVAEDTYRIEVVEFGWPAPPQDCGEGGDQRYDIYLMEIIEDCCLGYASPEGIVVDNPNSDHVEQWASYAHMVIDNDFKGSADPASVMRATLSHEFHHVIQFGYDINDELDWFYEATSSWMETQVFPEHEDATRYAEAIFEHPDVCIGSTPDSIHGDDRIYGEWLLIDSIVQDHGADSLHSLWNAIADHEGMTAFYAWTDAIGTTPQTLMQRYAVRNLLHEYDLSEYFYGQVRTEGTVKGATVLSPKGNGVEQLGTSYLHLPNPSVYHFSLDGANLSLFAVGIDTQAGNARVFELGQNGTVDLSSFDDGFLMIFNNSQNSNLNDCQPVSWTLNVAEGNSANAIAPTDTIYNAQNYLPMSGFR